MAENEHPEIVIIRRHGNHEDTHHGGAWKIAFADFMTAMMALFLVLWLISASTDKTKASIARYFNPVKLVDMSPLKKGFNDPKEVEAVSGSEGRNRIPSDSDEVSPQGTSGKSESGGATSGDKAATHAETALFRDPYAVLAEIAAANPTTDESKGSRGLAQISAEAVPPEDGPEPFQDPFATVPRASKSPPKSSAAADRPNPANARALMALREALPTPPVASPPPPAPPASAPSSPVPPTPATPANALAPAADANAPATTANAADRTTSDQQATAADARKLQAEIAKALPKDANTPPAPNIEVQSTPEGLLVSLTDDANFSMFAIGSAEPQPKTLQAMEKIAQLLKSRSGVIVVRGHTDARPFKSATYDNWRLSSARAQMAHYMLIRGGLDEKRIEKIEGYADRQPKNPSDPLASENRRIDILLRKDKP